MGCVFAGADTQGQLGDKAAEFKKIFRDEVTQISSSMLSAQRPGLDH